MDHFEKFTRIHEFDKLFCVRENTPKRLFVIGKSTNRTFTSHPSFPRPSTVAFSIFSLIFNEVYFHQFRS